MDSLSRTSLVPQTISFPLSAFAPDPHLRLIGCCLSLLPLVSIPLATPSANPSALLCPASGCHLHPRGSPSLPGCTRCLSSIPVPHRSWSILGPIPLSCAIPPLGFTPVVAVRCAHTVRICVPRSHISSAPNTFLPLTAPFQTTRYGLAVPWFIRPVSLVSPMPSTCRLSELPVV